MDDRKFSEILTQFRLRLEEMYGSFCDKLAASDRVQGSVLRKLEEMEKIAREVREMDVKLLAWMRRYVNLDTRLSKVEKALEKRDE
jgi:hypothetical protein